MSAQYNYCTIEVVRLLCENFCSVFLNRNFKRHIFAVGIFRLIARVYESFQIVLKRSSSYARINRKLTIHAELRYEWKESATFRLCSENSKGSGQVTLKNSTQNKYSRVFPRQLSRLGHHFLRVIESQKISSPERMIKSIFYRQSQTSFSQV